MNDWLASADWLLWGNNITSIMVVMLCWWLAHSHVNSDKRRWLAAGYGAVGMTTLSIALFRNLASEMPWFTVAGKLALSFLLIVEVWQRWRVRRVKTIRTR